MYTSSDRASKYFSEKVTPRDRAVFEAGIAVGMVVHQFTGIPVKSEEDARLLEKIIENAIKAQPFREDAKVKIRIDSPGDPSDPYSYTTLKTRNMDVSITVKYKGVRVKARLKYIPELDYNLAFIEDIEEAGG
ncbi:MAG: dihydroneopterin aldolase family protein [Desulfurococcus sp.]|nr:dihydroneopterin aldolase family protein [Desulfurococcus sp.]